MTSNLSLNRIQFVGHACIWLTLSDKHFFLDTNFSSKILGLKRHSEPGIDIHHLPDTSALLVTNPRHDHLDFFSYKYFSSRVPLVAPNGLGSFIQKFISNPVSELEPWESIEINEVKITAVPANHKSRRLFQMGSQQCNGYVLECNGLTVLYIGASGYAPLFREIGDRFKINYACLPIGGYEPAWLNQRKNMNPSEAVQAFKDLKADYMIPIQWGGFRISVETPHTPLYLLEKEILAPHLQEKVYILYPGQNVIF